MKKLKLFCIVVLLSSFACALSYMHFSATAQDLALSFFGFRVAQSIIE